MGTNPIAIVHHTLTPAAACSLPELLLADSAVRLFAPAESGWRWAFGAERVVASWNDKLEEPIARLRSTTRTMLPVSVALAREAVILGGTWLPWDAFTDDPFSGRTPYRAYACAVARAVRGNQATYVSDARAAADAEYEMYASRSFDQMKAWLHAEFGPPRDAVRDNESGEGVEWWHDDFADFDALEADLPRRLRAAVAFAEYGVDPLRIEPHPEGRGGYLCRPTRHWVQRPIGDPRGWRVEVPRGPLDVAPPMPVAGPPAAVPPAMFAAFDELAAALQRRIVVGWHLHKMTIEAEWGWKLPGVCMDGSILQYVGYRDGRYERADHIGAEDACLGLRLFDAPSLRHAEAVESYVAFAREQRFEPSGWVRSAEGVRPL